VHLDMDVLAPVLREVRQPGTFDRGEVDHAAETVVPTFKDGSARRFSTVTT
jgi:hypothetical protein